MSMAKIFKEQKDWLDKATKNIDTQKMSEKVLDFPETLKVKRQGDIKAKIATLKKQKEETVRRYDQAIEEQEKELVRLEKTIDVKKLQDIIQGKGGIKPDASKKTKTKKKTKSSNVKHKVSGTKKVKVKDLSKNLKTRVTKKKK